MKLYGSIASPYVARVVMAARLKGLDITLESAPGGMGSDEYRGINPTGKIPSLQTESGIITESEVICEYFEDICPDPSLLPGDPLLRAHSRSVSRITDLYIAPHNSGLIRQQSVENRDQALIDNAAAEFERGFAYLAYYMGPGPFAAGASPSLGDCAAAPFLLLLKRTVFPFFDEIPDPTTTNPRLTTWWQALQGDAACREALDECDEALEAFLKYLLERLRQRASAG